MPLDDIAVWGGRELPAKAPSFGGLMVVDVDRWPSRPQLAAWTVRMDRPALVAQVGTDGQPEALLMDRQGRVAGHHRGSVASGRLTVHQILGRRVGVLLGAEVWMPEVGRALGLAGVELVVGFRLPLTGSAYAPLWALAQQNQWMGVETGVPPRLVVPCEITPDESGVLAAVGEVSWWRLTPPWNERRRLVERDALLAQLNPAVYLRQPWWED